MTGRPRITVTIDRLVVDGVADARAIRRAVTAELQARMAERQVGDFDSTATAAVRVHAGSEAATPQGTAAAIGRALSREGGR